MIYTYSRSIQGDSHIKTNTPCQDASRVERFENGLVIAAVADGVGSAKNAQIGSKLAVNTVIDFCIKNMPIKENAEIPKEDLLALLKIAYYKAFKNIWNLAKKKQEDLHSYDTTLDTVIYDGNTLIYAHCSDGGIIVLDDTGKYSAITERLKGSDGESMIPLRFTNQWIFSHYELPVSAVMIFTDGVYDFVNQKYLEYNWKTPLYINLLRQFADRNAILSNGNTADEYTEILDNFMKQNFWKSVSDDKTVVSLINLEKETPLTEEKDYYEEPDWEKIKKNIDKKLYKNDE